jgi:hypothetical protein
MGKDDIKPIADSLSREEDAAIRFLCEYEKENRGGRGMRTIELEDRLSQQIAKPRSVLEDMWRKGYVSLHNPDGTEWHGGQNLFIDDAEQYCDTQIYIALRYKPTPKGRAAYKPSQEAERKEQEGSLEPKAPESLQKLLWIWKHGRKHWKLILSAIAIFLIWSILARFDLMSRFYTLIKDMCS